MWCYRNAFGLGSQCNDAKNTEATFKIITVIFSFKFYDVLNLHI